MLTRWRTWRARRRLGVKLAVRHLRLGADDILVFSTDETLSVEQVKRIEASIEQALPGLRTLVTSGGFELLAVSAAARGLGERATSYGRY